MTTPLTRHACCALFGGLLAAATAFAPHARADQIDGDDLGGRPEVASSVVDQIRESGGRYRWASASLTAADCSGLVSVAESLSMGQAPRRLGDTHTFMAGRWPHALPGASPDDRFIIGANAHHMVARIDGVNVESRQSGMPFLIGPQAASPFDPQFTRRAHVDPAVLV